MHTCIFFSTLLYIWAIYKVNSLCSAKTEISDLIQDSFEILVNDPEHQLTYNYPIMIFKKYPHFSLSVSKFEWKELKNIDYDISGQLNANKGSLMVKFQQKNMKWRLLKINYWLFDRQNMLAGITEFEKVKPSQEVSQIFQLSKQLRIKGPHKTILFASILSIKAEAVQQIFELELKTQIQTETKFNISLETGANTQISVIKITYLLYQPSVFGTEAYHHGTVSTKFNNRQSVVHTLFDIEIYPIQYSLMGVSAIRLINPYSQTISITMFYTQDPTDLLKLISSSTSLDNMKVSYLLIGQNMMMSCIQCPHSYIFKNIEQKSIQCISKDECQYIRSEDESKMHFSCRNCPESQNMKVVINEDKSFCQCLEGYNVQTNTGRCLKIKQLNAQKQCPGLFQIRDNNGTCICQQNYQRDEFGLCGGICTVSNSYWSHQQSACKCFQGYYIKIPTFNCEPIRKKCSQNQLLINDKCQCNANTVRQQFTERCILCHPGTYKIVKENKCSPCSPECESCVSQSSCVSCKEGYNLQNFQCIQICGDGKKLIENQDYCDDGNLQDGDGCSKQCMVEDGYICEGGSAFSMDICYVNEELIDVSANSNTQIPLEQANKGFVDENQEANYKKPEKVSAMEIPEQAYNLKLTRGSPMFLSSGIVINLEVDPQIKRTPEEVQRMFELSINETRALPQIVYFTQNTDIYSKIRCYLHYNNQLPVLNFMVTISAHFSSSIVRTLNIYANSMTSAISSSINVNGDNDELL